MSRTASKKKLSLDLTEIERNTLREILKFPPPWIDRALRAAPASGPISLTVDNLKKLALCVSFAADRTRKQTLQFGLDLLEAKIERLISSQGESPKKRTSRTGTKVR